MRSIELASRRQRRQDRAFAIAGGVVTALSACVLVVLLADLAIDGLGSIDWSFLSSYPSRDPDRAGILPAWVGSLLVMLVCGLTAIPIGVGAGIFLEEYARKNWFTAAIEINITNLAGVPSIVYGLMALGLLVYRFEMGQSVAAGGITLGFLVLPIIIVATREALRSIPQRMREAAYAVGASRWQVVKDHILPYSAGGIATGIIIALSRAIGETAPLITIGALTFIAFLPPAPIATEPELIVQPLEWLGSPFTVLPIQMFNWVSRPGTDFVHNAAATGLVLVAVTLCMNAVAIVIRYRMRKRIQW